MVDPSKITLDRALRFVHRVYRRLRPPTRTKVFGIGMPKTGTSTLGKCMQILGYKHHSYDMDLAATYVSGNVDAVIERARHFEAFENWPWHLAYRDLDKAFPDAKFIATHRRDVETFIDSHYRHRQRAGQLAPVETPKPGWWDDLFPEPYGTFDADYHRENYISHYESIDEYFSGRESDILHVCWEEGDGWEEICSFLEQPVPSTSFPHLNEG